MARRPLQRALDEVRFGRTGTLNLRASLPTASEATARAERWLRLKQAEGAREVLVITGRGNQSHARIPVVREAVRRLLVALSARGVVAEYREHSPGSFAVRLLPFGTNPGRPRESSEGESARSLEPATLEGLSDETRARLRRLALTALDVLGVRDPSPEFVRDEMVRQCAQLATTLPVSTAQSAAVREEQLRQAIERAIDRLDEQLR